MRIVKLIIAISFLFISSISYSEGIDEYTVLMLHCDGADESTDFPDDSASDHTMSVDPPCEVDTAIYKFATGAMLLNGGGASGFVYVNDSSADWDFGSGDWTIDLQVYRDADAPDWMRFVELGNYASNGIGIAIVSGVLYVTISATDYTFNWTTNVSTWYHLEVSRSGTNLRAFINGTQIGETKTNSTSISAESIYIGDWLNVGGRPWEGSIDEVRVSKGIARHTANFTAPTSAYSSGGGNNSQAIVNVFF